MTMDANNNYFCSSCHKTRPSEEFSFENSGRRMLCNECTNYHENRRLHTAPTNVVTQAESSSAAVAPKRARVTTMMIESPRVSPTAPIPTPVIPFPSTIPCTTLDPSQLTQTSPDLS